MRVPPRKSNTPQNFKYCRKVRSFAKKLLGSIGPFFLGGSPPKKIRGRRFHQSSALKRMASALFVMMLSVRTPRLRARMRMTSMPRSTPRAIRWGRATSSGSGVELPDDPLRLRESVGGARNAPEGTAMGTTPSPSPSADPLDVARLRWDSVCFMISAASAGKTFGKPTTYSETNGFSTRSPSAIICRTNSGICPTNSHVNTASVQREAPEC
mmetsp:Transcript_15412/g.25465  ORF Transcript_15412/g.25465 Transcript_15412/m.25465 type:complete len:212 (-) Transcript_15412:1283-1918(-)